MEILNKLVELLPVISQLFMAVAILATLIVRLTPSDADDRDAGKAIGYLLKVLNWMPTVGVNPRTKKLEEAYAELKAKK